MDNNIEGSWLVVVNPHAGGGRTALEWKRIEKLLNDRNVPYEARMTDCKLHASQMAFEAARDGYRRFIAVGGDGTIHEVLGGVMLYLDSFTPAPEAVRPSLNDFFLAVIPVGSGNDWIRVHGVSGDVEDTLGLILSESFAAQDVVRVTCEGGRSYMMNIGGVGFDARVCERVNRRKDAGRRGRLLYIWSLIYNFLHYKSSPTEVFLDGRRVYSGNCFSVAVGTGRYSGGGLRQTPDALTDDGLSDVTVIPPLPFLKIACEVRRLFDGTFTKVKDLVIGRGRTVTVKPLGPKAEIVEVDGEIIGRIPAVFEVLPERVNVLHRFPSAALQSR